MKKAAGQRGSKRDKSKDQDHFGERNVDVLVVGAGPAGLLEIQRLLAAGTAEDSFAVVESQDHVSGRATAGLHLLAAEAPLPAGFEAGRTFAPGKVRWEKQWVAMDAVDWEDEDWIASLPQWSYYLKGAKKEFLGLADELMECENADFIQLRNPVSGLERLTDTAEYAWKAQTPNGTFFCKRVVWAAGMPAFQNAYGKIEAAQFFEGNPVYQKEAGDFVGGLSLEIEFASKPTFESGFDENAVFAIPVRHDHKLSLLIGILSETPSQAIQATPTAGEESASADAATESATPQETPSAAAPAPRWTLKTLTHVHHELLADPKELLSFQKSLRRAIKHILTGECQQTFDKLREAWVVSPKVGGHMLGSAWCFGEGEAGTLAFVGDQTLQALRTGEFDLAGLLTQKTEEISEQSSASL